MIDKFHLVPIDDLREHRVETDERCWCNPCDDDGAIVHNSMDGREKYEHGKGSCHETMVRHQARHDR